MALLRVESFDHFDTATAPKKGWTLSTLATIGAGGRNSTSALECATNTNTAAQAVLGVSGATGATGVVGFAVRVSNTVRDARYPLVAFVSGSTQQITVALETTGEISVYRGPANGFGALLGTSVATLSVNSWYFMEVKCLFNTSTGTYEVRLDGVNILSATGQNTAGTSWNGLYFRAQDVFANAPNQPTFYFDDIYACDGTGGTNDTFLGDHRIVCVIASSGNGGQTDWSPSTGSDHGALVDENPPNESDYNQSGTAGHRDTYNFAAVGVSGTVKAVQTANLLKADAAGVRSVGDVIRISSTNYDGTGQSLGSDWSFKLAIHTTNPATSTAWTVGGVDGAEFGVKVTA
jgi:hypothetical protein